MAVQPINTDTTIPYFTIQKGYFAESQQKAATRYQFSLLELCRSRLPANENVTQSRNYVHYKGPTTEKLRNRICERILAVERQNCE